jgi:hypothetical protein
MVCENLFDAATTSGDEVIGRQGLLVLLQIVNKGDNLIASVNGTIGFSVLVSVHLPAKAIAIVGNFACKVCKITALPLIRPYQLAQLPALQMIAKFGVLPGLFAPETLRASIVLRAQHIVQDVIGADPHEQHDTVSPNTA